MYSAYIPDFSYKPMNTIYQLTHPLTYSKKNFLNQTNTFRQCPDRPRTVFRTEKPDWLTVQARWGHMLVLAAQEAWNREREREASAQSLSFCSFRLLPRSSYSL